MNEECEIEHEDEAPPAEDKPSSGYYEYIHCNWYWVPDGKDEEL
jgi:hypothetical protein